MDSYWLLLWWFAVLSHATGEIVFLEYRTEGACQAIHARYASIPSLTTTTCLQKTPKGDDHVLRAHSHRDGPSGPSRYQQSSRTA